MSCICSVCKIENEPILKWREQTQLLKCKHCKLLYTDRDFSDAFLEDFYQGFAFNKPYFTDEATLQRYLDIRIEFYTKHLNISPSSSDRQQTLLDMGAGNGVAVKAFAKMGYDAYYCDIDKSYDSFIRETLGISDENILDPGKIPTNSFDIVFSDNVMEHMKNPLQEMERIMAYLKPGGTAIIITPQAGSLDLYFNGTALGYFLKARKYNNIFKSLSVLTKRTWCLDPPRHLFSFSKKSFEVIMEKLPIRPGYHRIYDVDVRLFSQFNNLPRGMNAVHNIVDQDILTRIKRKLSRAKQKSARELMRIIFSKIRSKLFSLFRHPAKRLWGNSGIWGNNLIVEFKK